MNTELRVSIALLLALLGLEAAARLFETRLSKDVAHLRSLPAEAARLRDAPSDSCKVLILGNSLAREGLDRERLTRGLEARLGRPVVLAAMHPDGSRIEEWQYGYRRYFEQTGARPDLVLLCTGRAHLLDGLRDLDAVAAFHVSWRDLPGFVREQKLGVDGLCQVIAARTSALFAHRRRVQPLLFYHWMPRYEQTVNLIQAAGQGTARRSAATEEGARAFLGLLQTCRTAGTRVALLPVPLPEPYELPAGVVEAAQLGGAFTLGPPPRLPARHFPDGYHLDAEGAALWTAALLEQRGWDAWLSELRSGR